MNGLRLNGRSVPALCLGILLFCSMAVSARTSGDKTYQVGYIEAGTYWTYTSTLDAIKEALKTAPEWSSLNWSGKIAFPKNAYFSPGWENESGLREAAKQLMSRSDLDLIIAAGTAATGALLEVNNGKTPVLAMAVADAVKSGFVKSEAESGTGNFTVRVVPGRYKRMFQIFHDVIGFRKLGLMYPDTENGRKYSNVEDAQAVARERGFEIVKYPKIGMGETMEDCINGIEFLIDQDIDAFFIPTLNCFDWQQSDVKMLIDMLIANKIPTFAREGSKMVQAGALMGFSTYDFTERGRFLAERAIRILSGESAGSLPMVDNAIPKISLNLHVAELIGFDPSFDIIAASDEIYQEITLPEERKVK